MRSYEAEYVGGLFHWDCHVGSRKVLTARGEWVTPILFGVLDDRSRLACHLQWYLGAECAQNIVHGLSQAFMRRGLPRAAMSDNGAAMCAAEVTEGLARLGILHETTLPYSPAQNGKIEVLWANVEGRLLAMLEGVTDLTLDQLNEATQAWCEYLCGAHGSVALSRSSADSKRSAIATPQNLLQDGSLGYGRDSGIRRARL